MVILLRSRKYNISLYQFFICTYIGDPYNGACTPSQVRCASDGQCRTNEKCIQPGECICPPPFFTDSGDNNKCKSPCERMICGVSAKCIPNDVPSMSLFQHYISYFLMN